MRFIKTITSRNGREIDFKRVGALIEPLCKEYSINLLYVFGSCARGSIGRFSDIDVAFCARRSLSGNETDEFYASLQKLFEEEAIDLVNLAEAPPAIVHRVLKNGVCLFAGSIKERIEFETSSEALYFDTVPLRREFFAEMERRLVNGSFGHR
jgi:predicted nucleotidyltransferase